MRPEPFKTWTRPFRLKLRLTRYLPVSVAPRLQFALTEDNWRKVALIRHSDRLTLALGGRDAFDDDRCYYYYRTFLPCLIHPMARTSKSGTIRCELDDGSAIASDAVQFSAAFDNACLLPDPDFFNSHGYARQRQMAEAAPPWDERRPEMVWRGATSGDAGSLRSCGDEQPRDVQRVLFCRALQGMTRTDAKLTRVVEPMNPTADAVRLQTERLMGETQPEQSWIGRRFAFDIDGNTNAWSNLFVRLLFGCCVIKVGSPRGFRQWYYDRLVPWTHFIPVSADLSDLHVRIEWCWTHPAECRDIAANGRELAHAMTFDGEMREAARRLDARFGETQ